MENKLLKLREILEERGLDGIVIEKQMNFSWLTGGRGFIGLASENACGSIVVTKNDVCLVTNNIEAPRLSEVELPNGIKSADFLWCEESKRAELIKETAGENVAADSQLAGEFFGLRTILDSDEVESYRKAAKITATHLENSMKALKSGMSEFDLAGDLSARLWSEGIEPITLLIAFDDNIYKYRHPLPTKNKLKNHAMGVVCARYKGLIVSASRLAYIGDKLPDDLCNRHNAVVDVDAKLINATRPNVKLGELFNLLSDAYSQNGYTDEWKLHHQGGLTGYVAREIRAMPNDDTYEVKQNQAYAWNPSVTGTKSEDTIFAGETGNEILTHTGEWKYVETNGILRPDILLI